MLFGDGGRFTKMRFGACVHYDNLTDTTFEERPLLKAEHALPAGFTIAWILGQSETLMEGEN